MRIEQIKRDARDRWLLIIRDVGRRSESEFSSTVEGPCPKCGGTTRFRVFKDFNETGGCICSHCFQKGADGIDTIAWLLDVDKKESMRLIAENLGLVNGQQPEGKKDPARHLKFKDLDPIVLANWCNVVKKGIIPDAAAGFGVKVATYRDQLTVLAFPILGKDFGVCGWVIYGSHGQQLPYWTKGERTPKYKKVLLTSGSTAGLMGPFWHADGPQPRWPDGIQEVWKCEGPTDAMAFESREGRPISTMAVCNSNGAEEDPKAWIVKRFESLRARVIHDADEAGVDGASKWCRRLHGVASEVREVRLPYAVVASKGKDLRDYLNDDGGIENLIAIAENSPVYSPESIPAAVAEFPMQERVLRLLDIEVLYENDSGQVRCYSRNLKKTFTIRHVSKESVVDFIQNCGPPAKSCIVDEPITEDEITVSQAREAIALVASRLRQGKIKECGAGVWLGKSLDGHDVKTILVVGSGEAARLNGDSELTRVSGVRVDGVVLDMSEPMDWYDFDCMKKLVKQASDPAWRRDVIKQTAAFYKQWLWQRPSIDPELIVALILSTWVQSVWKWRPQVSISGSSGSGKSYFFKTLKSIFEGVCISSENGATEAGIRQFVKNSSKVLLLDEFENSKERQKVLGLIRTSSRGGTVIRGTSGQQGVQFGLRHITWVAAIETGLEQQADRNRFLQFEMLATASPTINKLPDDSIEELGKRLLAVAIVCAERAVRACDELTEMKWEGTDIRSVESYSVPAAMISVACDLDHVEVLREFLSSIDPEESPESDEVTLMGEILAAMVDCGHGIKHSVSEILGNLSLRTDPVISGRMAASGVVYNKDETVFVSPTLVKRYLIPQRQGRIEIVLQRLPGSRRNRARINGVQCKGLVFDIGKIMCRS